MVFGLNIVSSFNYLYLLTKLLFEMKKILLLLLIPFIFTTNSFASDFSQIIEAIKTGNVEVLSKMFDTSIDLKVLDQENVFTQAQAKLILKDFFSKNPPQSFSINHEGGTEASRFAIGKLSTAKGNYRIYFLIKKKGDELLIQKFRIEEDV